MWGLRRWAMRRSKDSRPQQLSPELWYTEKEVCSYWKGWKNWAFGIQKSNYFIFGCNMNMWSHHNPLESNTTKLILNTSKQLSYIVKTALIMKEIVMLMSIFRGDIHICSISYCEYKAAGTLEQEIKSLSMLQYLSIPHETLQAAETNVLKTVKWIILQH